ncbi:MAG: MucR family transcriptional regulator [Alphaproteobacteria bacterium]|nr:MucR family transcriptional regulator [Alphaproteobacteria bacterium]
MTDMHDHDILLHATTNVVAAHLSKTGMPVEAVPDVIRVVHKALSNVVNGGGKAKELAPEPAVSIKKSITPDYIVCLEDGRKLKMLKRHLMAAYGMTPDEYRKRWGLPANYPMVAPNYAQRRSQLAKAIGLGTQKRIKR